MTGSFLNSLRWYRNESVSIQGLRCYHAQVVCPYPAGYMLYRHCVWLRFLGAEEAKEEQKRADYSTAVSKHIAVATVKRIRTPDLHRSLDGLFRKDRCRFDDPSEWVDESRDTGVGGASESQVILDGAKHDH